VAPFMRVGNYPTRNFATLGHSGLMPPLAGTYICSFKNHFISFDNTWQASDLIHHLTISQSPVFLLNSRRSLFSHDPPIIVFLKQQIVWFSSSRSYRVNLPSSLNIILLYTFVHSYLLTCVGLSTVSPISFFLKSITKHNSRSFSFLCFILFYVPHNLILLDLMPYSVL
jgi:hypothetical protein